MTAWFWRVRKAIAHVCDDFEDVTSARQLARDHQDTQMRLPVRKPQGGGTLVWVVPTAATITKILSHPIFAGAYVWGRTRVQTVYRDGVVRKRLVRLPRPEDARVLLRDHHPAYISWERFEQNLARLSDNRSRCEDGQQHVGGRGAIRKGTALLTVLLYCGHCGRRFRPSYSVAARPLYRCYGERSETEQTRCFNVGAVRLDREIGRQLCRAPHPAAVRAATLAETLRADEQQNRIEQATLSVQAAQYEVDRALEQYDLVDPKNRLVADTLEGRLDQRLQELRVARDRADEARVAAQPLTDEQRGRLGELGEHFESVWNHPDADVALQKRILRTAIEQIIVTFDPETLEVEAVVHWHGRRHTSCRIRKPSRRRGGAANSDLVRSVRDLAVGTDDGDIARILNHNGLVPPRNLLWTADRVRQFRKHHRIRAEPALPGLFNSVQAGDYLGVAAHHVRPLASDGLVSRRGLDRSCRPVRAAPPRSSQSWLSSGPGRAGARWTEWLDTAAVPPVRPAASAGRC
ncbi:MAG: hypothetical protein ACI9WU_002561 [Myxococcota bacterium]|jgi:hypothetical protein